MRRVYTWIYIALLAAMPALAQSDSVGTLTINGPPHMVTLQPRTPEKLELTIDCTQPKNSPVLRFKHEHRVVRLDLCNWADPSEAFYPPFSYEAEGPLR